MNQNAFPIVQTLCRIALGTENPALRKQVERLKAQLEKDSDLDEAASIAKLLKNSVTPSAFQPSRMGISPIFSQKENLSKETPAPSDRETGAALAEIIFPSDEDLNFPLFDETLRSAMDSLLEEWKNSEKLKAAGIQPPSTCLIYGLPGTGKTCLALAIAAALGLPIVLARLDGLVSSFLGTTGRNIGNLFAFAGRYDCILLLDEFDAIAKVRDDPHEIGEIKRVVNAILQNIDQRRDAGITIAITNHEQLLDSAVWRRFDARIAVPPPSFQVRKEIVRKYFSPYLTDDTSIHFLAWLADEMTGSDIEVMANNLRRHQVLNPDSTLLSSLKHYSATQSGRTPYRHEKFLSMPPEKMAKEMASDETLGFSQRKIAKILDLSQSKVSRSKEEY